MSEVPHEDGTGMQAVGTGTAQVDGLTLRALLGIHLVMCNIRLAMCRHPGVPACPVYLPTLTRACTAGVQAVWHLPWVPAK